MISVSYITICLLDINILWPKMFTTDIVYVLGDELNKQYAFVEILMSNVVWMTVL